MMIQQHSEINSSPKTVKTCKSSQHELASSHEDLAEESLDEIRLPVERTIRKHTSMTAKREETRAMLNNGKSRGMMRIAMRINMDKRQGFAKLKQRASDRSLSSDFIELVPEGHQKNIIRNKLLM